MKNTSALTAALRMKHGILLCSILLAAAPLFSQIGKGVNPISTSSTNSTGTNRAVVIGISDYQDKDIPDLRFADKDAEAFANFLRSPAGGSLDGDHLQVLTNQNATAGRVAEAFDALVEQTKEGDQVIIYFSGHGDVERKTISQPGFLLCWDSPARVYMGGGTYSLAFLQEIVSTLSTQNKAKVMVVTDACHAGKLAGSQIGGSQATTANLAKQFANEVKILSCQPNEFSLEGEQWGGGRGIFSYHLVDGLAGLADRNGDGSVTVGEIDRYLEDHVTTEAAPQSQVPMLLGNKTERLATVNAAILEDLKKEKMSGMAVFAATVSRGFEEDVLANADSSIREQYLAFKKAVREKRFFQETENEGGVSNPTDVGPAAEELYAQLAENESLTPLRGMMRRNYAAALQDAAQQAMNIWLAADVQQLDCIGKTLKLDPIPGQLQRAAELLGEGHYMYRSLQARRLLFEGIIKMNHENPDEALGRKCLSLFRQSLALEAQSALPWHRMCLVYAINLRQPDSAFVCASQARNHAPNWVLPYADLGYTLSQQNKLELAKQALQEAEAIDSIHPYVINRWAWWLSKLGGKVNHEKASALFEKYRERGGPLYPCWFNDYGVNLINLGRYAESEAKFKEAIALDSTKSRGWSNLAALYTHTRRYAEAEPVLKKAIALDSTEASAFRGLGYLYILTRRYAEAEPFLKKAIALDSTHPFNWNNLGLAYTETRRYAEAEPLLKKAIALDSTLANPRKHLGMVYFKTNRPDEARQNFLKAIALNPNYAAAMLGMAYLLFSEGKTAEAIGQVEQAIGKGSTFEQLESDENLAPLRALLEWKAMMKKHFPEKVKD
ncbi:MAG: tetratricopeptide repeat protein [Saprospiraceae bacterium]|nr:tetratricopeptide repeat protein [Saprospiraceae bacterium]